MPGSGFHRSIELGGGASGESEAQKERHPDGCLSFWWTRRGSFFRRKTTSRSLLRRSPQVRRHKRFARQNLGEGRIHSARASQIAPGAERAKRAKPKKKDTQTGVFLFGGLEGDRFSAGKPRLDPFCAARRKCGVTSVLRGKTLAQGGFTPTEQVKSPLGRSERRERSPKRKTPTRVSFFLVDSKGIEPSTLRMRTVRSPN